MNQDSQQTPPGPADPRHPPGIPWAAGLRSVLESLRRFRSLLEGLEIGALLLLLGGMILLAFLQVVLRQFHGGLLWADVVVRHLVLWIAFAGSALAASRSRHITIDALGRLLKGPLRMTVRGLIDLLGAWICLRLAHAGFDFTAMSREFGETIDPLDLPAWTFQAVIPAGFALIAFHFLLDIPLMFGENLPQEDSPGLEIRRAESDAESCADPKGEHGR